MEENPKAFRSEAVDFLRGNFNIEVSESTVSRAMKRVRLARKGLSTGVDQQVGVDDETAADESERAEDT